MAQRLFIVLPPHLDNEPYSFFDPSPTWRKTRIRDLRAGTGWMFLHARSQRLHEFPDLRDRIGPRVWKEVIELSDKIGS